MSLWPNNYGATPMSLAAATGDAAIIGLLLKAGADPDSPNAEGQTALMAVARTGNVEAAKLLVRAGAHVNAREQWGNQTALMWAAAQRQPEMVKFLIRSHAEVDARGIVRDWARKVTSEPREKDMDRGGFTPCSTPRAKAASTARRRFSPAVRTSTCRIRTARRRWCSRSSIRDSTRRSF